MKTLIIGLDGGTWDIFGPLCDLNEMPNLAKLRQRAAWGPLRSTHPPFSAPAWATFATGMNPGKHGILGFRQHDGRPQSILRGEGTIINSSNIRAPLLWEYFDQAGLTVGSINTPLSYPLRPMRGFGISGLLTPPEARDWVQPQGLARTLNDYIIDLEYGKPGAPLTLADLPAPLEFLDDVMQMTERRGMHTLRIMMTQPWDTLMVVFTGTDRIFHHFWHYLQPARGNSGHQLNLDIADKLRAYFSLLDQILGAMLAKMRAQDTVILLSDHGFGPAARRWVHPNNWLLDLDLLRLRMSKASWMQQVKRSAPWLSDLAKRVLSPEARKTVQQHGHLADAIDWSNTLAWSAPIYNNVAGVYLNHADNASPGPVSPAAAPKLREFIMQQAQKLRIPGTNRPFFMAVQPREALYKGPYVSTFPDIILTMPENFAATPTLGATLITAIPPKQRLRSGDHRPDGMLLAAGPAIRSAYLERPPRLRDIAPTLLYLADLPIPKDMDGRVIAALFKGTHWNNHPPRSGPSLPTPPRANSLTDKETQALNDRLRGLGYR